MSLSFHLYQLQKLDSQVRQATQRMGEINLLLNQNELLLKAQKHLDDAAEAQENIRGKLREIEISAYNKRIKMEQSEAALYGGTVKNPKELQDLQTEIALLKKTIGQIEDTQLELMVAAEDSDQNYREAEAHLNTVKAEQASKHSTLTGELKTLRSLLDRLEIERNALLPQINPGLLESYNQLRAAKKGLAVAAVDEDCCTACGSTLTAAEIQSARSTARIVNCPTCGRILYAG